MRTSAAGIGWLWLVGVATLAMTAPQGAAAQTPQQIQVALHPEFDAGRGVRMINERGQPGRPGHWRMEREVSGARPQGGCQTVFQTPGVLSATNPTPAKTYTLPWNTVSEVRVDGSKIQWRAGHMADGEYGALQVANPARARAIGESFTALAKACGAKLTAAPAPATPAQPEKPCGIAANSTPQQFIAACNARLASGQFDTSTNEPFSLYAYRSEAHLQAGDLQRATADAEQAIRVQPKHPNGYLIRAVIRARQSQFAAALTDVDAALRLTPDAKGPLGLRVSMLLALKRYAEAMQSADRRLQLAPESAAVNNDACWTRALLGRELDRARTFCDKAIRLDPAEPAYLDSRGMVSLKQQRFEDAWRDYDAAVRQKPDGASYLYGRGIAALRLGRAAQGQAELAAARRLDPNIDQTYADYGIRP